AERTGAGVRAAGVEQHRAHPAAAQHLLRPQHRRGLHPVGGEHPGGGTKKPVVDDHGDVTNAGELEPSRHPSGTKPQRSGNAHGETPCWDKPTVSGRPSMRLAAWTAWPAAPLPRLSRTATTTARPACTSAAACRCAILEPLVAAVDGQRPSGSRWTNGAPS